MVFLKEIFKKFNFGKISRRQKKSVNCCVTPVLIPGVQGIVCLASLLKWTLLSLFFGRDHCLKDFYTKFETRSLLSFLSRLLLKLDIGQSPFSVKGMLYEFEDGTEKIGA